MQRLLKIGNRYTGAIDGDYGAGTVNAAKDFQRSDGLDVDGTWGKQCWGLLGKGGSDFYLIDWEPVAILYRVFNFLFFGS